MSEQIELELVPSYKLWYVNGFGVYACSSRSPDIEYNKKYDNFILNGEMPELVLGKTYRMVVELKYHKKHGKGYEFQYMKHNKATTTHDQHDFLRSILSESQCEPLIEAHPSEDIIQMIRDNTLDYSKIKGIGDKTYQKIKDKITENIDIQEALVELTKYGVTYTIIKKLLARYNNSPDLVIQKVKNNPYILCEEVNGLGFKKVDVYALKMGIDPDSPYRILSAVEYIIKEEESNGHCWIRLDYAVEKTSELTSQPEDEIIEFLNGSKPKTLYMDDLRIGSIKIYKEEKEIANKLNQLIHSKSKFHVSNVDSKIKAIEEKQGFEFTDEQLNAIKESIDHNVLIVSGKAGVGKSVLLRGIINVLNNYTYETCAFSGKAAQRIVEGAGLKSKTIHRLLQYVQGKGFTYKADNEVPIEIIVLDEGGMVNTQLFHALTTAVANNSKLIILGDIGQLAALGCGRCFIDMIESGKVKVCELTQVHRQAKKSGTLLAANMIREGRQIVNSGDYNAKSIGELNDLHLHPKRSGEEVYDHIIELCTKYKDKADLMEFQIIVPLNKRGLISTSSLNPVLQNIFNNTSEEGLKRGSVCFKKNDKIIKNGNDYDNGIFNGTMGKVIEVDYDERVLTIAFSGTNEIVKYGQDQLMSIDLAYALTVHRCQGSQFKQVILALDYSAYKILNRQIIYTGLTRTSETCVFVFELKALRNGISKNEVDNRNTYLKEMLINFDQ